MNSNESTFDILLESYREGHRNLTREVEAFAGRLSVWAHALAKPDGLPPDWRNRLKVYLAEEYDRGCTVVDEDLPPLWHWMQMLDAYYRRLKPRHGPVLRRRPHRGPDSVTEVHILERRGQLFGALADAAGPAVQDPELRAFALDGGEVAA